jgi:Cupredoxin-like domain
MIFISIGLVLILTVSTFLYVMQNKEKLSAMAGMMVAMTIGMMSSTTLGLLVGILLKHDLTTSTMVAVSFGLVAGFIAGIPISLMAAMDGMMAGIMGGMMGPMLGVMLSEPMKMVWFIDIVYLLMMVTLFVFIRSEVGGNQVSEEVSKMSKPILGSRIVIVGVLLLLGVFVVGMKINGSEEVSQSKADFASSDLPTIAVHANGYAPNVIELHASEGSAKVNFQADADAGCLLQVVSEQLGLNTILEKGNNEVTLNNLKPGTYEYRCGMDMYKGTIIVN